jgi:hypothetical protein
MINPQLVRRPRTEQCCVGVVVIGGFFSALLAFVIAVLTSEMVTLPGTRHETLRFACFASTDPQTRPRRWDKLVVCRSRCLDPAGQLAEGQGVLYPDR